MKILDFIGKVVSTIKLFPEFVTLPLLFIVLFGAEYVLMYLDPTIALYGIDFVQVLLIAFIGVMFANAAAHGAIKYNQPKVWEEYKKWKDTGVKPRGYYYFLGLYMLMFILFVLVFA